MEFKHTLNVDLETYSPEPLPKTGVHRYAEHPDFEILLFGYSLDGADKQVIDLAQGETIPFDLEALLFSPNVLKTAFNAAFEIACLSAHFGRPLPAEQWQCTSVLALTLGLPGHLADVAVACKFPADRQKLAVGGSLIRFFCIPCKPTKRNGGRTRNLPHHDPVRWATFVEYCGQDVVVEAAIREKLIRWAPIPAEQRLWVLDQKINNRGWHVDRELVDAAIAIDATIKDRLTREFCALTGIAKATQVKKLRAWLDEEHDIATESLDKAAVAKLLGAVQPEAVERALTLRQELSKSSVSKYQAIARSVCSDGCVRGLHQFYGAQRTGRWAGRLVQTQNLPKSTLSLAELTVARELVKRRDTDVIEAIFGDPLALLSELIRSAFCPPKGKATVVVDFSAIEAVVVAWAAGCEWRMEVFRTHGKIYEASAAAMFHVPLESIGKKSPLRQKGKIAELALGYHGSVGALITMGAIEMGIPLGDLQPLVDTWRAANPEIMTLGKDMERDAKACLRSKMAKGKPGKYLFRYSSGMLFLDLPSGRSLCYARPVIEKSDTGFWNITYDAPDPNTKQPGRVETYAGKLLENYTQAVARDCLAVALTRMDAAGFDIRGHVHDEAVCVCDEADADRELARAIEIFAKPIPWAPGLPLKGDGFTSHFYRKDA